MSRTKIMAGNWKMNQTVNEITTFFSQLEKEKSSFKCEAWISPQAIHLQLVKELGNKLGIKVGPQNCCNKNSGAFTGELSPLSIKDMGATFVIIGHSERRTIYKESDAVLNEKTLLALDNNLKVVFCVGETLEEREGNLTEKVLETQLTQGLKNLPKAKEKDLVIAYEPVWAIGTGKNATPAQARDAHAFIRNFLVKQGLDAQNLSILYGGSVKPDNVVELLAQDGIDGALVGGASLKASDYIKLCQACSK